MGIVIANVTEFANGLADRVLERSPRCRTPRSELKATLVAALQGAHRMGRVHPGGEIRRDSLSGARTLLERFATRSVAGEVME